MWVGFCVEVLVMFIGFVVLRFGVGGWFIALVFSGFGRVAFVGL